MLGIHNAGHQGVFSPTAFPGLDVSSRWWGTIDFDGSMNLLKCGVVTAERIVAVSPTYASEIQGDLGKA